MSNLEDSFEDFQKPPVIIRLRKRTRSISTFEKRTVDKSDTEEITYCSLCRLPWTTSGVHATVNLKCGHVYGESCVKKHIYQSIAKSNVAKCPVCDNIVKKREPRRIYPNKVLPCDENELRELKREHEEADMFIQMLIEERRFVDREINQLKEELNKYMPEEELKRKMSF